MPCRGPQAQVSAAPAMTCELRHRSAKKRRSNRLRPVPRRRSALPSAASANTPGCIFATAMLDHGTGQLGAQLPGCVVRSGDHLTNLVDHQWDSPRKLGFAADSLLEGDGFELSVPREEKPILRDGLCRFFPTLPFREGPNPSAFASRNVSAGNSGTLGYLQDDPSIPQPLSGSAGDLIDHAGVRSRCVAPSPSTAWRRASRRALRCGQPACAWKWRRRHGSGEPPCMQRRFPAASCRLPGQGPDR